MKKILHGLIFILVLFIVFDTSAESEWMDLFDGETLDGWVTQITPARPDNRPEAEKASKPPPAHLRPADQRGTCRFFVEDGCIVGRAEFYSTSGYLCTEKEYGNFELQFEVFLGWPETKTAGCNSGIQIRSTWNPEEKTHCLSGVQVDIDERPGFAGALFAEGGEFKKAGCETVPHPKDDPNPHTHFKANEWNRMRIRAIGPMIQTWVNDQPVTDADLPKLYEHQPRGFIGLQVHEIGNPRPAEVRWRKLRIIELDEHP